MNNVNLTWELPTARTSGKPLAAEDILHVEVSLSADEGSTFGVLGTVLSTDAQTFTQTELEDGYWVFRFVVVDKRGLRSANVDFATDTSVPEVVFNVNFTLG